MLGGPDRHLMHPLVSSSHETVIYVPARSTEAPVCIVKPTIQYGMTFPTESTPLTYGPSNWCRFGTKVAGPLKTICANKGPLRLRLAWVSRGLESSLSISRPYMKVTSHKGNVMINIQCYKTGPGRPTNHMEDGVQNGQQSICLKLKR